MFFRVVDLVPSRGKVEGRAANQGVISISLTVSLISGSSFILGGRMTAVLILDL